MGTASERTTEVNILCDISLIIKQRFKTNVTIISPARVQSNEQRSDPLTQILRNGRIIIFQFKKPFSYLSNRNNNYVKFVIETQQHYNLLKMLLVLYGGAGGEGNVDGEDRDGLAAWGPGQHNDLAGLLIMKPLGKKAATSLAMVGVLLCQAGMMSVAVCPLDLLSVTPPWSGHQMVVCTAVCVQ